MTSGKKKISFYELDEKVSSLIDRCFADAYITASDNILDGYIQELSDCSSLVRSIKRQAFAMVGRNVEEEELIELQANCFLYMHCVLSAVESMLRCFRDVRGGKGEKAWSFLIDAYEYLEVSYKAALITNAEDRQLASIHTLRERLEKIEALFPGHALYNSPGFVETIGNCSVCGISFYDCDHVEGEIYKGRYCQRVNRKILEVEHFALVEYPRDRRCVFTKIPMGDGYKKNYFSREIEFEKSSESDTYNAILFCAKSLDLD